MRVEEPTSEEKIKWQIPISAMQILRMSSTMPDEKLNGVTYTGFPEPRSKGQSIRVLAHLVEPHMK